MPRSDHFLHRGEVFLGLLPEDDLDYLLDLACCLPEDRKQLFLELMRELDQLAEADNRMDEARAASFQADSQTASDADQSAA